MGGYVRLRRLLLGEEQERLAEHAAALARLAEDARELPQRLPEALATAARGAGRERLAQALSLPVADALGDAVVTRRALIVDALFPVIGPAIRKAIAEALRGLVADINAALESSLTPRGIAWRIEAWRTGVPYAEVVLKHTLKYRIEHLFLIERDSGLVLHRESAPELPDLDSDAIAGMLTAIGEFVKDSVGRQGGATLDAARVGEHLLLVVEGPRANLACFVLGVPPRALQDVLQRRLELAHERLAERAGQLRGGAADPGEALAEALRVAAIVAELRQRGPPAPRRAPLPLLLLLVALLAGAALFGWREWRWAQQLAALNARLAEWPGLHVERISSVPRESVTVHGLIDPLADRPDAALGALLPAGVELRLATRGYLSTDAELVLRRARAMLSPPDGVELALDGTRLSISGRLDAARAEQLLRDARLVPGVEAVDASGLVREPAASRAGLEALLEALAASEVVFEPGAATRAHDAELDALAAALREAAEYADRLGFALKVASYGLSDDSGSATLNAELRARRARWLADALGEATGLEVSVLALAGGDPRATLDRRAARLALSIEPRTAR